MEIPVTNAKRAIRFYRDVFQWNIHDEGYDQQVEGIERVHFFSKGNFRGSFQLVSEDQFFNMSEAFAGTLSKDHGCGKEQQRGPLLGVTSTFAVEDMDETLEKIVVGGGRIFQYVHIRFASLDLLHLTNLTDDRVVEINKLLEEQWALSPSLLIQRGMSSLCFHFNFGILSEKALCLCISWNCSNRYPHASFSFLIYFAFLDMPTRSLLTLN
jgi:predicted enzyme related to lactoylglutathione lyase